MYTVLMNNLPLLTAELAAIVSLEGDKPNDILASYIVGELLGDYDDLYEGLEDAYSDVRTVGDLASDLEISNGNEEQLAELWDLLKEHVRRLEERVKNEE